MDMVQEVMGLYMECSIQVDLREVGHKVNEGDKTQAVAWVVDHQAKGNKKEGVVGWEKGVADCQEEGVASF